MPDAAIAVIRPIVSECGKPTGLGLYHFDARGIDPRLRRAAFFAALEALNPGETMRFYDDHDPLPLLVQVDVVFGARVKAIYVSRNPSEVLIDFRIGPAPGA